MAGFGQGWALTSPIDRVHHSTARRYATAARLGRRRPGRLVAAGQLGSYLLSAAAARRMLERSAGAQTRAKRDRSTRRSTCCGRVRRMRGRSSRGLDVPPSTRRPYCEAKLPGGFHRGFAKAMARAGAPGFSPHESDSLSVPAMSVEYLRQRGGDVWLGDGVGAEGQRPWAQLPANSPSREPQAVPRGLQATTALFCF